MPAFTNLWHTASFAISHDNASPRTTLKSIDSVVIQHVFQSLFILLWHAHKIVTNEYEYPWVRLRVLYSRVQLRLLASSIASTRECMSEYSRVDAREFWLACGQGITRVWARHHSRVGKASLACRQCITRVYSYTLAFSTRVWYCVRRESLALVC